jgi:acetyl-CoA synthetase
MSTSTSGESASGSMDPLLEERRTFPPSEQFAAQAVATADRY